MKYDATLKKLFQNPPSRLLSYVLGEPVVVTRILPTEQITVENLHPDLLFETSSGTLIHTELHGYPMDAFEVRNLLYFALTLRDYQRPPVQIVFWHGKGPPGVSDGLDVANQLWYRYRVIDVRTIDAEFLLESTEVGEVIFGILCSFKDAPRTVARILRRISLLPLGDQREAMAHLLVLSGLRGLTPLIYEETKHMPITIDLHENEFFEGIYQDGRREGHQAGLQAGRLEARLENSREILLGLLTAKYETVPVDIKARIDSASYEELNGWIIRSAHSPSLPGVFE